MIQIRFFLVCTSLLNWFTFSLNIHAKPVDTEKPNIIFILTDDQGWGDIHINGNMFLNTPVIDNFARNAVCFNRFYVSPLCAPTRSSFLTGRYHLRTGVTGVSGGREIMNSNELTIAEILKQQGYNTGCFGKWHNGEYFPVNANGQGFDVFFGFNGGHLSDFFNPQLNFNNEKVSTKGYITDILADSAISFIQKNKNQSFFCYIPFNAPHAPYQVPDKYFNKYSNAGFDAVTASVYGMCENLDENIARILNTIDVLGIAERTIVVFSSDNGPNSKLRYNGGLKGWKGQPDEGGVRVPFYIQWKNHFMPHNINNKLAAHIDLLPTLLELCNIKISGDYLPDGVSLVPLLQKEDANWPNRTIFTHTLSGDLTPYPGSLRDNDYCLILRKEDSSLYNLKHDPGQTQNLSSVYPEIRDNLKRKYEKWFYDVSKKIGEDVIVSTGYNEASFVELPATYARFNGKLRFRGAGFDNDWLINWTNEMDSIWWKIDNQENADFELSVYYTCPENALGTEVKVTINNQTLKCKITESFLPEPYKTSDRAPRGGVYEKPFKQLHLGDIFIPFGIQTVSLKSQNIAGDGCEIKSICLNKKK